MKSQGLCFLLFLIIGACAPGTLIRPLKPKEKMVSASLGGPLIHFAGTTIPIPFSQVDFAYGYSDRLSLQAGLNTTALLFGVGQLRLNALYEFRKPAGWKPGLSGYFQQHLMLDRWEKQFSWYPEPGFHLYWSLKPEKHMLFAGASSWMEFRKPDNTHIRQSVLLPVISLGYQHSSPCWNWTFETRWIAPGRTPGNQVVDYVSPGKSGALGCYVSLSRKF
jgi:hypothetical protein